MEIFTNIISLMLILGLFLVPIIIYILIKKINFKKFDFLRYLIFGTIITAAIMWTFAWWADYSDQLLLSNYGYDFDAMNNSDRFVKVKSENLERVKQLEIGYFGIGWPLQAILAFVLYFPYLLIVYLIGQVISRKKRI